MLNRTVLCMLSLALNIVSGVTNEGKQDRVESVYKASILIPYFELDNAI